MCKSKLWFAHIVLYANIMCPSDIKTRAVHSRSREDFQEVLIWLTSLTPFSWHLSAMVCSKHGGFCWWQHPWSLRVGFCQLEQCFTMITTQQKRYNPQERVTANRPKMVGGPGSLPMCAPQDDSTYVSDWAGWILSQDAKKTSPCSESQPERLRKLVQTAVEHNHLEGHLAEIRAQEKGAEAASQHVLDFAESCLMSFAFWLRFGSADFAEKLCWVERTDYAAMTALPNRAVDAAVSLWQCGMHATGANTRRQRSVRQIELRAWNLGANKEQEKELQAAEDAVKLSFSPSNVKALVKCRARRVNQAGEVMVRQAYERLVVGQQHSLWDLWRKRDFIVKAILQGGGFRPLREALRTVRGYCGPDMDNEHEAWNLAVDLFTLTPFTESSGPVWKIGDYAAFLRERQLKRCIVVWKPGGLPPRGRPSLRGASQGPQPDLTGLAGAAWA